MCVFVCADFLNGHLLVAPALKEKQTTGKENTAAESRVSTNGNLLNFKTCSDPVPLELVTFHIKHHKK